MLRFLGSVPSHFELIPCLMFFWREWLSNIYVCVYMYVYILYIYIYGEPRTVNTVNITKVLVLILFPATTKARNQQHSMETTHPLHGKLEHHLPYIPQCLCSAGWNGLYIVFAPKILGVWLYIVPPVRNRLLMNCSRNWSFQRKKTPINLSLGHYLKSTRFLVSFLDLFFRPRMRKNSWQTMQTKL